MSLWSGLLLFFALCLVHASNGVECGKISVEEDVELEKQLKLLNKPSISIIETKYGEVYDCVDFYQQPAFDHPALKNHSIHYPQKTTTYPRRNGSSMLHGLLSIWKNGKSCPTGTVPIKRITKEDLIRANLAANLFSTRDNPPMQGVDYCILRTKNNSGKYYGGGMESAIYQPNIAPNQYSACRLIVHNGQDAIVAGWMVYHEIFGDDRSHLFIYTLTAGQHCYNLQCPGFISTRPDIPVGASFVQISTRGGPVYDMDFVIRRDPANGNWNLELGNYTIGYWPANIFTDLKNPASDVEWGGQVYGEPNSSTPVLGAGSKILKLDPNFDAYARRIVIVDETNTFRDPTDPEVYNTNTNDYSCQSMGRQGSNFWTFYYGGPRALN